MVTCDCGQPAPFAVRVEGRYTREPLCCTCLVQLVELAHKQGRSHVPVTTSDGLQLGVAL